MHGHGFFTFADGGKYDGNWKDGKMHGHGFFTFADGVVANLKTISRMDMVFIRGMMDMCTKEYGNTEKS